MRRLMSLAVVAGAVLLVSAGCTVEVEDDGPVENLVEDVSDDE